MSYHSGSSSGSSSSSSSGSSSSSSSGSSSSSNSSNITANTSSAAPAATYSTSSSIYTPPSSTPTGVSSAPLLDTLVGYVTVNGRSHPYHGPYHTMPDGTMMTDSTHGSDGSLYITPALGTGAEEETAEEVKADDETLYPPRFVQIHHILREQIPGWVEDEGSNIAELLTVYYEWLEVNVTSPMTPEFQDVDAVEEEFLNYFAAQYANFVNEFALEAPNKRQAIKYAKQLYNSKGTSKSFELFFKLLFGINPSIYYTRDNVIASSSVDASYASKVIFSTELTKYGQIAAVEKLKQIRLNEIYLVDMVSSQQYYDRVEIVFDSEINFKNIDITNASFTFEYSKLNLEALDLVKGVSQNMYKDGPEAVHGFRVSDQLKILPTSNADGSPLNPRKTTSGKAECTLASPGEPKSIIFFASGKDYKINDNITFSENYSSFNIIISKVNPLPPAPGEVDPDFYEDLPTGAITQIKIPGNEFISLVEGSDPPTEKDPIIAQIKGQSLINFFDSPEINIKTKNGTGAVLNVIIPDAGRFAEMQITETGANLTSTNTKVPVISNLLLGISDTEKIIGNPIVEFQIWNTQYQKWTSDGYGGQIVTSADSGGRVTIAPVPEGKGHVSYLRKVPGGNDPAELMTMESLLPEYRNTPIKLVVVQQQTGSIIDDDYGIGFDLQVLKTNPPTDFVYDKIASVRVINTGDQQILNSFSARQRDKVFINEYSYFIKSPISALKWSSVFKETLHPAGFAFISEVLTTENKNNLAGIKMDKAIQYSRSGLYLSNETKSYGFPNRVIPQVSDYTIYGNYTNGRQIVPGAQFIDLPGQCSVGFDQYFDYAAMGLQSFNRFDGKLVISYDTTTELTSSFVIETEPDPTELSEITLNGSASVSVPQSALEYYWTAVSWPAGLHQNPDSKMTQQKSQN